MSGRVDVSLSGLEVTLLDLPGTIEAALRRDWAAFLAPPGTTPVLRCSFEPLDREAGSAPFAPKQMRSTLECGRAVFSMPEGRCEVDSGGSARIGLARGLGRRDYWTAMNLLRAALAWVLPGQGAALVHAAGLVVEGRGYLLVGPEGSGKSSFAAIGERAGGRVVSDDLVLCDLEGGEARILGAPFRSTHRGRLEPGAWPLAALLFPHRGAVARWSPAPRIVARGRITANLPFVADAALRDERVAGVIERLSSVPCLDLSFALDPSFLDLLRAGPPAGGGGG